MKKFIVDLRASDNHEMPTLALAPVTESISAEEVGFNNWKNNCSALRSTQSDLVDALEAVELEVEWVYARDGSVTALGLDRQWWEDCSVPLLASRMLLKSLEDGAVGSCILDPTMAGMVQAARERMGPLAVLMVVQPSLQSTRMILSCFDFSEEISKHRLWFAWGDDWAEQLRGVLDDQPGLATPVRFIRTKLSGDELILPMITTAQDVFSGVLAVRSKQIELIKSEAGDAKNSDRILHVGGTEFRLWDFGSGIIQAQLEGREVRRFDTDDALCGSPLALLQSAIDCGAIVSANLSRGDSSHLTDLDVPWITWVTVASIPAFGSAGRRDGLILADANWRGLARAAGWPEDRVRVCGWPAVREVGRNVEVGLPLGFICDTVAIQIPATIKDFSSHRLLWDLIEEELAADPLMLEGVEAYLADRAQQLNVKIEALDKRAFIEQLILPAYQQGLARLLTASQVPISLWGKGWADLPEFAGVCGGAVESREDFESAITRCGGLIYCWPVKEAHPIEMAGKPVLYRAGKDASQIVRNARRLLAGAGRSAPSSANEQRLLGKVIEELIGRK